MDLRPYQHEAVAAIRAKLQEHASTVLVMATGLGKTRVFCEVVRDWPGRALVLAHRDELIQQAQGRLEDELGEPVEVEQAEFRASTMFRHTVVASVQTLSQPRRLQRWARDAFSLVVVDEAHHSPATTYQRILANFTEAKVLGVTATPDRADRKAMGETYDSVAGVWDIEDGISGSWLCPIRLHTVHTDAVNLEHVKTTAGDLNQGDLDAIMSTEKALHAVAKPTIELAGDRRGLVFTTSVANAYRMAEIFCRYRKGCAEAVDGTTDFDERRDRLARHRAGAFQFLVNVGVLTEGYDDPGLAVISVGRPSKSRALYAQMIGRGTRIAPGKMDLLALDFKGNAGRHVLVSPHDVLAGKYSDEVVERAKQLAQDGGDVLGELREAQAQIDREAEARARRALELEEAARRAAVRGRVPFQTREVDPFRLFQVPDPAREWGGQFGGAPASEKQIAFLRNLKVPIPEDGYTKQQATKLIGVAKWRRQRGLCTFGHMKALQRRGYDAKAITFDQARSLMDALARNNWRDLSRAESDAILRGSAA